MIHFAIERGFLLPDGTAPIVETVEPNGDIGMHRLIAPADTTGETTLPVPPASALFVSGNSVLAAWEEMSGTRVAVYQLDSR